jgi:hypothetical protein
LIQDSWKNHSSFYWLAENKEWTGSNYLDIPSTSKISYKNNPFNYINGEEQYVTNPHAKMLLDYRVSFSSDRSRNATVATYQLDYEKWKKRSDFR